MKNQMDTLSRPQNQSKSRRQSARLRSAIEPLEQRQLLSGTLTTLANFGTTPYGGYEIASGVTRDASGNLFGTTLLGGTNGAGTVYEVAAGSGAITTLANFDATSGGTNAGVTLDANGDLFGTTSGGANSDGTVFEIVAGSGTLTTLHSFDGTDGNHPKAAVTLNANGDLFGTTQSGGAGGGGTVFEIAAGTGVATVLGNFNSTTGADPTSGVTLDSHGDLFGTTLYGASALGGANYADGTVFEVVHGSHTVTTLASFNGTNGQSPFGGVVLDSAGNLLNDRAWRRRPLRRHGLRGGGRNPRD